MISGTAGPLTRVQILARLNAAAVALTDTTTSTSSSTGAMTSLGGLGIAKDSVFGERLGVGALSSTGVLNVSANPLTGTTQTGIIAQMTGTSAGTGNIRGLTVSLASASAAYTATQMTGVAVTTQTLGAGSTITRFAGVHVTRSAVATNNAAFSHDTSSTPSYSGNYFLYGATTDPSHLGGALTINTGALTMSAATGTTIAVTSTTDSTSLASGSVILQGGMAVAKRLTLDGATGKTLRIVNATANAAVATTLGSVGPTGSTAGNPQGWMRVDINGTDRFIPFW